MNKVKSRAFTVLLRLCEQQTALFIFSLILVVLYYPNPISGGGVWGGG